MSRRIPLKQAPADADCRTWMAGALIMAAAYVLPTPPRNTALATPANDEGARADALAPHESCTTVHAPGS
ncbi:MAG: hypothetical protein ABIW82_14305 [Dokdonella sp.]